MYDLVRGHPCEKSRSTVVLWESCGKTLKYEESGETDCGVQSGDDDDVKCTCLWDEWEEPKTDGYNPTDRYPDWSSGVNLGCDPRPAGGTGLLPVRVGVTRNYMLKSGVSR